VPIVIRNAEVIAERNSSTFNPGTVDVAVFPPIPIDDWTTENLEERIAEVRQLYLDTLKDWPHDELPDVPLYARVKKAPVKKAAAKPPATKVPAKKAVAKKAPAKKAPAKKTAAQPNPAKTTRTTKGRP
jgi:putative phosphoserine phosphatase/1-acylglycerol-3-phosphate O-acyltransferase